MSGFIHFSVHTDRSIGWGMISPERLVEWSHGCGLPAAVITDHSTLSAAIQLDKFCNKKNIKPIFGVQFNVVEDKTRKLRDYQSICLIAKNKIGFNNLIKLTTISHMYFYYRPRIDWSDIEKYGEGLIVLTRTVNGVGLYAYSKSREDGIIELDKKLKSMVEDVYFEFEPAPVAIQIAYIKGLDQLCSDVKVIATGNCYYENKEDRWLHEAFMKAKISNDSWEYPFTASEHHLRSFEEMVDAFRVFTKLNVEEHPAIKKGIYISPFRLMSEVESFEISDGIKIPSFYA